MRRSIVLGLVVSACFASALAAERVTVFAAASLQSALDQVSRDWSSATGHEVRPVYAASSALARQIAQGAPADIFVSASVAWMDNLAQAGAIDQASRRNLLTNRLVLIGRGEALGGFADLPARLGEGHLAMALLESVPAGQYGKSALSSLGLWESVAGNVVQADNVRGALALVALGEAEMGVVYATDALIEPRVSVLAVFPPESHPPIVYPVALTPQATEAAAKFLDYLGGDQAFAVFAAQGFGRSGG